METLKFGDQTLELSWHVYSPLIPNRLSFGIKDTSVNDVVRLANLLNGVDSFVVIRDDHEEKFNGFTKVESASFLRTVGLVEIILTT